MGVDKHMSQMPQQAMLYCPSHGLLPRALILLHFPLHPLVMNSIHHCMDVSVATREEERQERKTMEDV